MRADCPYNRLTPCMVCGGTGLQDVEGEESELVVGPVCTDCKSEGMINTHKEPCLWCKVLDLEDKVNNLVQSLKIQNKILNDKIDDHIGDDSHDVVV